MQPVNNLLFETFFIKSEPPQKLAVIPSFAARTANKKYALKYSERAL